MKWIIIALLVLALFPLASADYYIINQTGDQNCGSGVVCSGNIYLNVTTKDHTFNGFKIDKNQTTTGKTKDVYSYLEIYHWKKDKWEHLLPDKDFKFVKGVHLLVVNGTKDGKSDLKWGVPQIELDPYWYGLPVGLEDQQGWSIHLWNEIDDYYINTTNDIQLSNHWDEVWSKNTQTIKIKKGFSWYSFNLSQLNLTWTNSTDNSTYANYTGSGFIDLGNYNVSLNLTYNLLSEANTIKVIPVIENLGNESIEVVYQWKISDIQIGNDTTNDYINVNGTNYYLNESLNFTSSNQNDPMIFLRDDIIDEQMWLEWSSSYNFTYQVKSEANQTNAPITLYLEMGNIEPNETGNLHVHWIDATCSWSCEITAPTGNQNVSVGDSWSMDGQIGYVGTCVTSGTATARVNGTTMNATTDISTQQTNPQTLFGCGAGICGFSAITVSADVSGYYATDWACIFNRGQSLNSVDRMVNATALPVAGNCTYFQMGSDLTLTQNNNTHCFNLTADDITLDCDGYEIVGNGYVTDNWTVIAEGRDNITIENCFFRNWSQVIYFEDTNNSLIYNNTFYNTSDISSGEVTAYAIYLDDAHDNEIDLNNITLMKTATTTSTHCDGGDLMGIKLINADSVSISNNHIQDLNGTMEYDVIEGGGCNPATDNIGYAIYMDGENDIIYNNNIVSARYMGIRLWDGDGFNVSHNSLSDPTYEGEFGIYGASSAENGDVEYNNVQQYQAGYSFLGDYINVSYNNASYLSVQGFNIDSTHLGEVTNNRLDNVNITGSGLIVSGLDAEKVDSITITNFTTTGAVAAAFVIELHQPQEISNINIQDANIGILFDSDDNRLINSTISGTTNRSIWIANSGDDNQDIINTTFNYSQIDIDYEDIEVYWYLWVNVTNETYTPLSGASVNVTDTYGTKIENSTDTNGLTDRLEILHFYENTTTRKYYNNYTINASYISRHNFNETTVNITYSQVVHLILTGKCWIQYENHFADGDDLLFIPADCQCLFRTDELFGV